MERVESDRGHLYVHNGYIYQSNKVVNGIRYVQCNVPCCPSRASVTDFSILNLLKHNHEASEAEVEMLHLKVELKRAAVQNSDRGPKDIFNDVCRQFPLAAPLLGYSNVRSTVYRYRHQGMPPLPNSLEEFAQTLLDERWNHYAKVLGETEEPFFRGLDGGGSAAVYISPRLKDALRNCSRLHIDASYKVLPDQLQASQLLTIHAEHKSFLFPVVFAIMSKKTQHAYHSLFTYVKEQIPEWVPQVVLSDFKPAARNAIQEVWPTAEIVGCFFHYGQAVYRMQERLQMKPLVQENPKAMMALKMLMSLALLPAERIAAGLQSVKDLLRQHNLEDQFRPLLEYMDNYWMQVVGPSTFSVCGQPHFINNDVENFYRLLRKTMGEQISVWEFHRKLRLIEADLWIDQSRLANKGRLVRPRRQEYVKQEGIIQRARTWLQKGDASVADCLKKVSYCTITLHESFEGEIQRKSPGQRKNASAKNMRSNPVMPLLASQAPAPVEDLSEMDIEDSKLFIKHENLEQDIDMKEFNSTVPNKASAEDNQQFEDSQLEQVADSSISPKIKLDQEGGETMAPVEFVPVNFQTEPEEEASDKRKEGQNSTETLELTMPKQRKEWENQQIAKECSSRGPLLSYPGMNSVGSSVPVGTTLIAAPISNRDTDQGGTNQYLLLVAQPSQGGVSVPQLPQTSWQPLPQLQHYQSIFPPVFPPPIVLPVAPPAPTRTKWTECTKDDSEIFSVSLAHFPASTRLAIKRKLVELVDAVETKSINPEKMIIAYHGDS